MVMFYTGIGSKKTPPHIGEVITRLAELACARGYVLRSGGAPGADTFFEEGAGDQKEIYLPWEKFNGNPSPLHDKSIQTSCQAYQTAERFHPAWSRLTWAVKKLMVRNVYQVLGSKMDAPSDFVLCWAPIKKLSSDGRILDVEGGTGLAVRLAVYHEIPVYNLNFQPHFDFFYNQIESGFFTPP